MTRPATSYLSSLCPASVGGALPVHRFTGVDLTSSGHGGCCLSGAFWVKYFSQASSVLGKGPASQPPQVEELCVSVIRGFCCVPGAWFPHSL